MNKLLIIGVIIALVVGAIFVFGVSKNNSTNDIQKCADETSNLELGQAKAICKQKVCDVLPSAKRTDCYNKVESIIK